MPPPNLPQYSYFSQTRPMPRFQATMGPDPGGLSPFTRQITQSGQEAFFRSLGRDLGGPAAGFIDRPQAGIEYEPGFWGMVQRGLGHIPYFGDLFRAGMAANTANTYRGAWTAAPDPSQESFGSRAFTSLGSTMGLLPGGLGPGVRTAKQVFSGVSGLMGAPEVFGTSWGEMGAGLAGRTAGSMIPSSSPNSDWSPAMSESAFMSPSWANTGFAGASNFAIQRPMGYDYAQERMGG